MLRSALRTWPVLLLLASLILAPAAHAEKTSWFVNATSGNDNNPGTRTSPCQTINGCLSKNVQPGDTIHVEAGSYGCFYVDKSGVAGAPISFVGASGVIVNTGNCGNGVYIATNQHDIAIRGFEIGGFSAAGIGATGGGSYNLTFSRNVIHDNGGGGVIVVGADCVTISGNRVYNNAYTETNSTSGISIYEFVLQPNCSALADGFRNHITRNEGFNNDNRFPGATDGNCIIVDDMRHTQSAPHVVYNGPTLIYGNYCHDNGGRGIHVYSSDNVSIYGNTVANNCKNLAICLANPPDGVGEINCGACGGVIANNNVITPSANEYGVAYRGQSGMPNAADGNRICASGFGDHYFDPMQGNTWGVHNRSNCG